MDLDVCLQTVPIAEVVDALLELADETRGEAHPADAEPVKLSRQVDVVDGRGPVLDLVDGDLELERARGQRTGQVAVHGRDLDDRSPKPRRRSAEGSRLQLERAAVEIEPFGIAGRKRGRLVLEAGPGDRRECGGDGAVRRVGRQVGHELDRVGGEHRAAGVDPSVDVGDRLEMVGVGPEPVPPAGGERPERGGIQNVLERSPGPCQLACRLLGEHRKDARVGPKRGGVARRGDPDPVADAGRGRTADEPRPEPRNQLAQRGRIPAIRVAGYQRSAAELHRVAGNPTRQRRAVRSPG